jgi:hypothetical protein
LDLVYICPDIKDRAPEDILTQATPAAPLPALAAMQRNVSNHFGLPLLIPTFLQVVHASQTGKIRIDAGFNSPSVYTCVFMLESPLHKQVFQTAMAF